MYAIVRNDKVLSTEAISKEKTTIEAIKMNCFKRCLNGICFLVVYVEFGLLKCVMRTLCALYAHELRTSCAAGAHRNGLLQRHCRRTAEALQ